MVVYQEFTSDVILCYTNSPHEPMLVCNHRAFGGPALYKLYKTKKEITEVIPNNNTNKKNIVLGIKWKSSR
ncbi:hypothetical protein INT48_009282 [Thamnidium elegans]|uniref:Uncharacterized protein n=1 Tax=Thamnidium elegans TaxID=101142 RepID=A0A8H7SNH1_9FUNG|nr:hypothetical protein INT48_009282 [Thamnidium elegans]